MHTFLAVKIKIIQKAMSLTEMTVSLNVRFFEMFK